MAGSVSFSLLMNHHHLIFSWRRSEAHFSGTFGCLIGAKMTLFPAVQSLKHTPVALLIQIIKPVDSYRRVMTDDT